MISREMVMLSGLVLLIIAVGAWTGIPVTVQLLVSAFGYALIALGLNVQWGYAGLFNFGVMGFVMLGGYATVLVATPVNMDFWNSEGPWLLLRALAAAAVGGALVYFAHKSDRYGVTGRLRAFVIVLAWFAAYIGYRSQIDPAAAYIEANAGFVGGLGLPVLVSWVFGAVLAGYVAYWIGRICLGLRTDYLAIATIGISEIIRAFMKNMDWLTRGTLTVSPIPWPSPTAREMVESGMADPSTALTLSRSIFLAITVLLVFGVYILLQRAYYGPWGRMMRAIRDNHVSAAAMGKNVKGRQLEVFVLGSALMGVGGAILTNYISIYDPGGFQPINHTFILWVMVIVGGAGNNLGAAFGGVLIIIVWNMAEPVSRLLFEQLDVIVQTMGLPGIEDLESRALQMRVFVLGLVIVLSLRFAPRGLIPERIGPKK